MLSVSIDDVIERLKGIHNEKIELLKYGGSVTHKSDFRCGVCGFEWSARTNSVLSGNGCRECKKSTLANAFKFSYEYVKSYIESKDCKLISEEYKNGRLPLIIQFSCGHISDKICFNSFSQGRRCMICGHNNTGKVNRISEENIMKIMSQNNFTFISFPNGYKDRTSLIQFVCSDGHFNEYKLREFFKKTTCRECTKIKISTETKGSGGSNWKGGLTILRKYIKHQIPDWKKKSMENCGYKCAITGKRFSDIHHLYSLNQILKESIDELGLQTKETIGEYSQEELSSLIKKVNEIHDRYPLGICLTREVHNAFHKIYGNKENYPYQFEEFKTKILSEEIRI